MKSSTFWAFLGAALFIESPFVAAFPSLNFLKNAFGSIFFLTVSAVASADFPTGQSSSPLTSLIDSMTCSISSHLISSCSATSLLALILITILSYGSSMLGHNCWTSFGESYPVGMNILSLFVNSGDTGLESKNRCSK